jgi:hypothetical protein
MRRCPLERNERGRHDLSHWIHYFKDLCLCDLAEKQTSLLYQTSDGKNLHWIQDSRSSEVWKSIVGERGLTCPPT